MKIRRHLTSLLFSLLPVVASAAPTIGTQPANVTVTAGAPVTLTVAATGTGTLTYQWQRNGFNIAGATNQNFTSITSASRTDADYYNVVVTDSADAANPVTSARARLSVAPTSYPGFVVPDPAWNVRTEYVGGTGLAIAPIPSGASVAPGGHYVGGSFTTVNGTSRPMLFRVKADGTLDTSFNPPTLDNQVNALALQSDGKLLVGGVFFRLGGYLGRNFLVRLNTDGTVDNSFNPNLNNPINAIAVQPADGLIVIGGSFTTVNGVGGVNRIARLNTNGLTDPTFNSGTGFNNTVNAIVLQANGSIVVGGSFTTYGPATNVNRLARLTNLGALDTTLNIGTGTTAGPDNTVVALAVQASNGAILLGGSFLTYNAVGSVRLARISSTGALDTAFNTAIGSSFNSTVNAITLQDDTGSVVGQALVGGNFGSTAPVSRAFFCRLLNTGAPDTTVASLVPSSNVNAVALAADGKVLLGGSFTNIIVSGVSNLRTVCARLNSDATLTLDASWIPTRGTGNSVATVLPLANGKMIVSGLFTTVRGAASSFNIARFNSDGTLDQTFNLNGGVTVIPVLTGGSGYTSAPTVTLSGGGGAGATATATVANGAVTTITITAAGSGYTSAPTVVFSGPGTGATASASVFGLGAQGGAVTAASLLPDGRIAIGGNFTTYNSVTRNRIAILNADGTLDTTFNPSGVVTGVTVSPGGAGYTAVPSVTFTGGGGTGAAATATVVSGAVTAVTMSSSGTGYTSAPAVSFGAAGATTVAGATATIGSNSLVNGQVFTLSVLPGGRLFVGGSFTTANGFSINRVAIFKPDGTRDPSFAPTTGAADTVFASVVQPDGNIIIGGQFATYNGTARADIARITQLGALDTTFISTGTAFSSNSQIYSLALVFNPVANIGQVVAGGNFSTFNAVATVGVSRLSSTGTLDSTFVSPGYTGAGVLVQEDGAVLARHGTNFTNPVSTGMLRLGQTNGNRDTTFAVGGLSGSGVNFAPIVMRDNGQFITSDNLTGLVATQAAPTSQITTQPVAQVVAPGGSATFSVTPVSTSPATFQWLFNSNPIPGATASSYTVANAQANNAGLYSVIVTNESGSTTSAPVALTSSTAAPSITGQPVSQNIKVGENATFTVAATGTGTLGYQWRKNGYPISGATGTSYSITGAVQADSDVYDVVVTAGLTTTTSNVARLGVAPASYPGALRLDPTFNLPVEADFVGQIVAVVPYNATQVLVAGDFIRVNGNSNIRRLARINIADGSVDTTFVPNINATVSTILAQPDGKVVVGGAFVAVNGQNRNNFVRLNADGSIDSSFNVGSGAANSVLAIVRQPADGKLIIGGSFTSYNGVTANRICRINTDGTLDPTFAVGSTQGVANTVNALALDPLTGKVVLGGTFTTHAVTTVSLNRIARFNTDGTNDTTFVIGTGFDNTVSAVAFDTTSNVLVGGTFLNYNGSTVNHLARLTATGSFDTTFNARAGTGYTSAPTVAFGGGGGTGASATATISGGSISGFTITGGSGYTSAPTVTLTGGGGTGASAATTITGGVVTAINLIGTAMGTSTTIGINSLTYDTAGNRWIVGGSFTAYNGTTFNRIIRLSAAGVIDSTFNPNSNGTVLATMVHTDGSVIIGGSFGSAGGGTVGGVTARMLAHVNSTTGAFDSTLVTQFRAAGTVNRIMALPGGKLLIGGSFSHLGSTPAPNIARLNADLSIDLAPLSGGGDGYVTTAAPTVTFSGGGGTGAAATAIVDATVGRVTGFTVTAGGSGYTSAPSVAVSNGGGSAAIATAAVSGGVVASVSLNQGGAGPNGSVLVSALQGDGKILIGGNFTTYNGVVANRVARLNADLSLDPTFNAAGGASGAVNALALIPGGGVYVGGAFSTINSQPRAGVARLLADGSLDFGFNAGSVAFTVNALALQPDGRVVAGGTFSTVNGSARANLVRFNNDGSFDNSIPVTGTTGQVRTLQLQSDGKILAGGDFTAYNGLAVNALVRINTDGTLDSTYNTGTTVTNAATGVGVYSIVRQEDGSGKSIVQGNFTTGFSGAPSSRYLARIGPDGLIDPSLNFQTGATPQLLNQPQPGSLVILDDGKALFAVNALTASNFERTGLIRLAPLTALPTISNVASTGVRPGATVTLTGTEFTDASAVRFGGPNGGLATFTVNSPTSITATLPSSAVSGPVFVQTLYGSATSATSLTVFPDFQLRNPQTTVSTFESGLAFGNGVIVAASLSGSLWSSADGIAWTRRFTGVNALNSVAFASGQFVAVGAAGTLLTSPDGVTWTQRLVATTASLTGVASDGAKWVIVTNGTNVVTSPDGAAWTIFATGTSGGASSNAVAFGAGKFVAVAASGAVRTSTDGTTWTAQTSGVTSTLSKITFAGGQFFATGASTSSTTFTNASGGIVTSPDGITWTPRAISGTSGAAQFASTTFYSAAFSPALNKYVLGTNGGTFLSSTDGGATWTSTSLNGGQIRSVLFVNNQFVGAGSGGNIYTSPDGTTWTLRQSVSPRTHRSIAYGNGRFVAVTTESSGFATSVDGVTWTAGINAGGSTNALNSITFGNGLFVAAGTNTILTSPDGVNWTNRTPAGSFTFNGVAYGNGAYVAVANAVSSLGVAFRSTDGGVTWTQVAATGLTTNLSAVAYGAGMFTAVGASGGAITSADGGVTWSVVTTNTTNALNAVTFANGQFVIVGAASTILTSQSLTAPAGLTLTARPFVAASLTLSGVAYGDGTFVAVNSSSTGFYLVSSDAVTWTLVTGSSEVWGPGTPGITYGNGRFVVGSSAGGILSSGPASDTFQITTQPVAAISVPPGQTASLSVAGTGTGLTYQWYAGASGDISNPVGTNSPNFTTPAINVPLKFWVRVSNGTTSIDSATSFVSGNPPAPVITLQPVDVSVVSGQTASFSVAATGTGSLTYQWRRNGLPVTGATGTGFSVVGAKMSDADMYDVTVSDAFSTTASNPARLGVAPTADPIGVQFDPAFDLQLENETGGVANIVVPYGTNGQFLMGGDFVRVNGTTIRRLARFNADGTLDPTFSQAFNNPVNALFVLPDGKIIVGGGFNQINGVAIGALKRLNADGTVDPTFNPGGSGAGSTVLAIARQTDGKLIIGGAFTTYNGSTANRICRLTADGALDPTFLIGASQGVANQVNALALDPSTGKIVLGGTFTTHAVTTISLNRIARFNVDGTNDASFVVGTGFNNTVNAIGFEPNGKVVVGGAFTSYGVTNNARFLVRLLSTGAIDTTFNYNPPVGSGYTSAPTIAFNLNGGTGATATTTFDAVSGQLTTITLGNGGSGYTAAPTVTFSGGGGTGATAITTITGGVVTAINFNSGGPSTTVNSLAYDSIGSRWIVGGAFTSYNGGPTFNRLIRVSSTGALDTSFNPNVSSTVNSIFIRSSDAAIVFGGSFTNVGNQPLPTIRSIARVDSVTGVLDATLAPPVFRSVGTISSMLALPGGKVLIAGAFTHSGATAVGSVARLNPDLSLDTTFNPGGVGTAGSVFTTALQGDGRIVIGGSFTSYNGATINRLARLNADGTLDPSFAIGAGGPNGNVNSLLALPGGRVLIGGAFSSYNGTGRGGVARINADGTLDFTFNAGSTAFTVFSIGQQADGKVVAGGSFTSVNGVSKNFLVRLNTDGSIDPNFLSGGGPSAQVRTVLVQKNGKIIIGGDQTAYDGITTTRITQLNADGTLDAAFGVGMSMSSGVSAIIRREDGKYLVTGLFGSVSTLDPDTNISTTELNTSMVARLNADGTFDGGFANLTGSPLNFTVNLPAMQTLVLDDGTMLVGTNQFTLFGQNRFGVIRFRAVGLPKITTQPTSVVAAIGQNANFSVAIADVDLTTAYQWSRDGVAVDGATKSTLALTNVQSADGGTYTVRIANGLGSVTSVPVTLSGANAAPTITTQPVAANAAGGGNASLSVVAGGTPTYQWRKFGVPIAGATGATLNFTAPGLDAAGFYDVVVSDGLSSRVSSSAALTVAPATYPGAMKPRDSFATRIETSGQVTAIASLADGRFYAAGNFTSIDGVVRQGIARFLATGSLDTAWVPVKVIGTVNALAVQGDGKIIAGGGFFNVEGVAASRIVRLNSDGSRDTSFAYGAGFSGNPTSIAIQGDGKIIVGGAFTSYNSTLVNRIVRLNTDGSYDPSFAIGLGFDNTVSALLVQPDGKIVAGGSFTTYNSAVLAPRILRLAADGSVDPTFAPGAGFDTTVSSLALQSDGKILAGGSFTSFALAPVGFIARLNANGSRDPSIPAGSGFLSGSQVLSIAVQGDGKIVAGGVFTSYNGTVANRLVRLDGATGAIDSDFGTAMGTGFGGTVNAVAVQADGRILVGGSFATLNDLPQFSLARLTTAGAPDPSVVASVRTPGTVIAAQPVAGGKLVIGGAFTHVNNVAVFNIARLSADGTTDTTFDSGTGFNGAVRSIVLQGGGQLVVGGSFTTYKDAIANRIVRLSADGATDTAFAGAIGTGFNGQVNSLVQIPDGRIVAGGTFTTLNGVSSNRIARILGAGSPDLGFATLQGFNGTVTALAVQPDGRIVAGGSFTTFAGNSSSGIARVNVDGSFDTGFAVGTGLGGSANALLVQSDGKIVVGGAFGTFNDYSQGNIARLNSDGSLDFGFQSGVGFNNTVNSLALQADGRIVVGGSFGTFNTARRGTLARLATNGTLDPSLGARFAIDASVATPTGLLFNQDGSLLLLGTRFDYPDRTHSGLSLLEGTASPMIISQPFGGVYQPGANAVALNVGGAGTAPFTYQWKKDNVNLVDGIGGTFGSKSPTVGFEYAKPSDSGSYTVTITDATGSVTSIPLPVSVVATAPVIRTQTGFPYGPVIQAGTINPVRVAVNASTPLTAQWQKNGTNISGGIIDTTRVAYPILGWKPSDAGTYGVTLTNSLGAPVSSIPSRLFVNEESSWTQHNPSVGNGALGPITVVNGRFLVGGSLGIRLSSPDGVTWTQLPSFDQSRVAGFASGNGRHVQLGVLGSVAVSLDGESWQLGNLGVYEPANSITFGQGLFVVGTEASSDSVSRQSKIFTSPDGFVWTERFSTPLGKIFAGRVGNGTFAAVFHDDNFGRVLRSTDGITWSMQGNLPVESISLFGFANGLFFVGGETGELYTSPDAITWTKRPTGHGTALYTIHYANSLYVAAGEGGNIYTSSDLVTWTRRQSGTTTVLSEIAYANGTWVVVSDFETTPAVILTSPDTITWTPRVTNVGDATSFQALATDGNVMVAVGVGGIIARTTDGVNWTLANNASTAQLNDVTYAGGRFLATGVSGVLRTSVDGATWGGTTFATTVNGSYIGVLNGVYINTGDLGTIRRSTDGNTWTTVSTPTVNRIFGAAYGAGTYVAVGALGTVLTSPDATTWTARTSGTVAQLTEVAYGNGLFLAVGASGTILTSPDGVTWTSRNFNGNEFYNHVQFTGGQFIVSGANAVYMTPDGVAWEGHHLGISGSLTETVVYKNRLFGVSSTRGAIVSAPYTPVIAQQPFIAGSVTPGQPVSLRVLAAGSAAQVTYQWRKGGVAINGQTNSTFTIPVSVAGDSGNYDVVVTASGVSVPSVVAPVSVTTAPVIADQPTSRRAVAGGKVQFRVSATTIATGATLTYQWRKGTTNIPGATTSDLTLSGITAGDAASYNVVVGDGNGTTTSNSAVLTVLTPDNVPWQQFTELSTEQSPARTIHDGAGKVYVPWSVFNRNPDMVAGKLVGGLARFNEADGTLDPTFKLDPRYRHVSHIALQPDGKVLVAVNAGDSATVIRVSSTGVLDNTFTAPQFARGIRFITLQADGKVIVVATDNLDANAPAAAIGAAAPSVYRLTSTGALDSAGFTPVVLSANSNIFGPPVVDSSGRIYLVGPFSTVNGTSRINMARLAGDGTLDAAFAAPANLPAGFGSNQARGIAFQSDGRPVIVGDFRYTARGTGPDAIQAIRFSTAGVFDTTFAQPLRSALGIASGFRIRYLNILQDDKIVAVTDRLLRLNADGSPDTTFTSRVLGKEAVWISKGADNRFYLPDQLSIYGKNLALPTWGNGIAVTAADGTPDASFQTGGWGRAAYPSEGVVLSDGSFWVAGNFNRVGSTYTPGAARFEANGSLSATQPSSDRSMTYTTIAPAGSDKIFVIAGAPSNASDVNSGGSELLRATPNAAPDASFVPVLPSGYNLLSASLSAAPGGKVMLAQSSITPEAALAGAIGDSLIRLNAIGTRDTTYVPTLSSFAVVERSSTGGPITMIRTGGLKVVQVLADGRALVLVSAVDGNLRLLRLTATGAVDATFNAPSFGTITPATGFTSAVTDPLNPATPAQQYPISTYVAADLVRSAVQMPDGRVYVGGRFKLSYTNAPRGLARLNADGTLDTTFVGVGAAYANADSSPYVTELGSDGIGRLYLAGRFDSFNGTAVAGLARLGVDGTLDTAWAPGFGVLDVPTADARFVFAGTQLHVFGTVGSAGDVLPAFHRVVSIGTGPTVAPATASNGTPVTISGFGFTGATAVRFNGVDVSSFTVVSDNQITTAVPTFATSGVVTIVTPGGTLTATTSFTVVAGPKMLVVSSLGNVGLGENALMANFTIEGSAAKSVLVRAVGPSSSLSLADPMVAVYDATGAVVAFNDDWGGTTALTNAFAAAGAAGYSSATSKDAALIATLAPGTYTAHVTGVGGTTGRAMVEVYDTGDANRLAHISSRSAIQSGGTNTTGFVLSGTGSKTVLIRAVGTPLVPALGALTNPSLKVFTGATQVAANDDWTTNSNLIELAAATAAVGAMPLDASDAAVLVTLAPGAYTIQVSGVGTAAGFVMTEVHTVDSVRAASFAPAMLAPLAPLNVLPGSPIHLNAPYVSKPGTVTFQWKKDGVNVTSATGFGPQTYFVANATGADSGSYTVTMTNTAGTTVSVPAVVTVLVKHSADFSGDYKIDLNELTRVIQLYNTRNGTVRTGRYLVQATGTEDGFNVDLTTPNIATVSLARYHSADSDKDGKITLVELTRVIELYNTRAGTTRTGAYRTQLGTEDGFASAP